MQLLRFFCAFGFLVVLFSGCGQAIPEGFPKTTPCTIIVTDNGQPLEGVSVMISTEPPMSSLSIAAKTDDAGKAVLQTFQGSYSTTGIPVGNVVLTLVKRAVVEETKTQEQVEAMSPRELEQYQRERDANTAKLPKVIPDILSNPATSPLKKEIIVNQATEWVVDIAEYRK